MYIALVDYMYVYAYMHMYSITHVVLYACGPERAYIMILG